MTKLSFTIVMTRTVKDEKIDDKEEYLNVKIKIIQVAINKILSPYDKANKIPKYVATPFPPLNFNQTGNKWPRKIHNEEIKVGKQLSDEEVMKLLIKQAQQRKDSIEAFKNAQRSDLVDKESEELEIISKYLPEQISEEKIKELAQKAIQETNAESVKDLGKIMPILMKQLGGQADGKTVNKIVMELLN